MKRLAARLQARLLERSLLSLGERACGLVTKELMQLRVTIGALLCTMETRLGAQGATDAH